MYIFALPIPGFSVPSSITWRPLFSQTTQIREFIYILLYPPGQFPKFLFLLSCTVLAPTEQMGLIWKQRPQHKQGKGLIIWASPCISRRGHLEAAVAQGQQHDVYVKALRLVSRASSLLGDGVWADPSVWASSSGSFETENFWLGAEKTK